MQPHKIEVERLGESHPSARSEYMSRRNHKGELIVPIRPALDTLQRPPVDEDADVRSVRCNRVGDCSADTFFEVYVYARMSCHECAQRLRQELSDCGDIGEQPDMTRRTASILAHDLAQAVQVVENTP